MILNRQRTVRVARRPLEKFLRRVKSELGLGHTSVSVCFVSDAEIARMNEAYRKKAGATDVLSFPARRSKRNVRGERRTPGPLPELVRSNTEFTEDAEKRRQRSESEERYLGDIAIAPQTARRYAKKNGRSLDSELRVLILHGVLHLLGYDHETDRGQMNRVEQKMRRKLGLA